MHLSLDSYAGRTIQYNGAETAQESTESKGNTQQKHKKKVTYINVTFFPHRGVTGNRDPPEHMRDKMQKILKRILGKEAEPGRKKPKEDLKKTLGKHWKT